MAFGSTVVGTSVNQSFTITDVGTVPLTIGSLSISDLNAADFSQTNNCAASITPGGFCTVTVAFTPSATGLRIATLIIPEDGGGVALGLNLSGTGTSTAGGPPALSSLILGPVGGAGSSSYQGTVTLWSAAPGGGALVTLSSDNPSVASVPSSVLVPATATAITFSVPTANVSASSTAAISATYGSFTLSSSLTLIPPAITVTPRSSVLTFNQTQQFQAVGSNIANNNVTWSVDGIQGGNSQVGILSPSGLYTPPALVGSHTITAVSQLDSSLNGVAQVYVTNYDGIFTQHNDNFRSGQNLQETVLTPSNVNPVQFGKLYSVPVDGSVYAQPLYVPNLLIPGQGSHNVVFVVTEHDSVYAFDADSGSSAPLWHDSFINPSAGITTLPPQDIGGGPIGGEVGITGTPVIDPGTGTMFVAAITKETGKYFWRLHALNIATGAEKPGSPVVISGEVSGTGVGTDGTNVAFDPLWHLNRPGLLELNGVVYVAFGSEGDLGQWHGWLFAFDASTLNLLSVFCTTPNGSDGAVWQGGGGLAADSLGNIYFTTGNGTFDANIGGSDYSDSVLKIKLQTSGLAVLDYFTPYDQAVLAFNDEDLGSGGPLLLSDQPGSFPHLLTVAGKGGTLYLINRDNLGKFQSGSDSQIVQSIRAEFPASSEIGVFGIPAEWNGQVFYQSEGDTLKAFALSNGMLPNPPQKGPDVFGDRGASPSISASGTSNGIVWVLQQDAWSTNGPSILHAYSASNIQQELYTSGQVASRDQAGVAVRFSVPTVANGRVFVGGGFSLTVYAPLP